MPGDRLRFTWPHECKVGEVVLVHHPTGKSPEMFTVDFGDGTCTTSNVEADEWERADV